MKDYYRILNVSPNSSENEIKKQYRFFSHAYHSDKFPKLDQKKQADEKFIEMKKAYDILSDPKKRKEYDEKHRKEAGKTTLSYEKIARLYIMLERLRSVFRSKNEKDISTNNKIAPILSNCYPSLFCFELWLKGKKKRKLYINTPIEVLKNKNFPICLGFDKATALEKSLLKSISNTIPYPECILNTDFVESDTYAFSGLALKINWNKENNDLANKIHSIIKTFTDQWRVLYEAIHIQQLDVYVTPLKIFEGGYNESFANQEAYTINNMFQKSSSRSVYWNIRLFNPTNDRREFTASATLYRHNNNTIYGSEYRENFIAEPNQTVYLQSYWGWDYPGQWEQNVYRVELCIENNIVGNIFFTIT